MFIRFSFLFLPFFTFFVRGGLERGFTHCDEGVEYSDGLFRVQRRRGESRVVANFEEVGYGREVGGDYLRGLISKASFSFPVFLGFFLVFWGRREGNLDRACLR